MRIQSDGEKKIASCALNSWWRFAHLIGQAMADLLDDETFKIGYEDEDARIHRVGGHQEIKRQLHVFLANQEYRSAWSALEKLIKMDKPDVSEYYEVS